MNYDLNQPWLSLDDWQKKYIFETQPTKNCFLLTGRQSGKTTAMSIKAVELCVHYFKKGQNILICSITEKQAYRMLAKAQAYAEINYPKILIRKGKDKPTMHKLLFTTGAGIYCYAAGETGEGLRGDTIKKLMIDEGSRMSEEFFIATLPMLSVAKGSIDIASTPFGKKNKDGSEKYFYKCSKDSDFEKFYVSAEDCPRHDKEFLAKQKQTLSRLAYAQEYLAEFTDELTRIFDDDLINEICILKRRNKIEPNRRYYLGADIAGFGKDQTAIETFDKISKDEIEQVENIVENKKLTTEISNKIKELNKSYDKIYKIGIDDGGLGFGVYSELMDDEKTKRKTEALNNSSRISNDERTKKLLKEEMYINLLSLMENKKIKLLDDPEIKSSLSSMQFDEDGKVFGFNSHIAEGMVRGAWEAVKDKTLKFFIHTF